VAVASASGPESTRDRGQRPASLSLVPCGKRIVVASSRVDVRDHNPKTIYRAYGRLRQQSPFDQAIITVQLMVVEV